MVVTFCHEPFPLRRSMAMDAVMSVFGLFTANVMVSASLS